MVWLEEASDGLCDYSTRCEDVASSLYATWFGVGRANEQEESPRPPKLTTKFPWSPWMASGCSSRFSGARIGEKERSEKAERARKHTHTFAKLTPSNLYTLHLPILPYLPAILCIAQPSPSTHLCPRKFSPHSLSPFPPPQTQKDLYSLIHSSHPLEHVSSTRNSRRSQVEYVSRAMWHSPCHNPIQSIFTALDPLHPRTGQGQSSREKPFTNVADLGQC